MIDHILDHKLNLGEFKKIDIVSSIPSLQNNGIRYLLQEKKTAKNTSTWRLNNMLLSNHQLPEEINE